MQEHSFTIASTFADASDLAERAGVLCARAGAADLSDSLRLCLAEALNNVVEHAYSGDGSGQIDVTLKLGAGGFDVTVADGGAPMPGGVVPAGEPGMDRRDLERLPEGGFGWFLIRNEVDRLAYERRCGRNFLSMARVADA